MFFKCYFVVLTRLGAREDAELLHLQWDAAGEVAARTASDIWGSLLSHGEMCESNTVIELET